MKSPCKKLCQLDSNKKFCTGCGRTLEEIRAAGEATKKVLHRKDYFSFEPIASKRPHREPLISFKEACEKFSISQAKLRGFLRNPDAPKPEIAMRGKAYYQECVLKTFLQNHNII